MTTSEVGSARRVALERLLERGEPLLWSAEATGAPASVWLPGCMAVPFLLIGLISLVIGVGGAMGGPDPYTGYQSAKLFGGIGAVFTAIGLFFGWLPFRLRRRHGDAIYGLTPTRFLRLLDATRGGSLSAVALGTIESVEADPDSDGSGTLKLRMPTMRLRHGRQQRFVEAWTARGVPDVAAAKALIEQQIATARGNGSVAPG